MSSEAPRCKPFIRQALGLLDCHKLALTMRIADREEIHHGSRRSPFEALHRSIRNSDSVFTIEKEGRVVAMFGVVGKRGQAGSPWMLGTEEIAHCWSLLRECRQRVDAYTAEYGYLTNAVWSENTVHIKWLKWLGFTFEGSDVRNGETFLHFHRRLNGNHQPGGVDGPRAGGVLHGQTV